MTINRSCLHCKQSNSISPPTKKSLWKIYLYMNISQFLYKNKMSLRTLNSITEYFLTISVCVKYWNTTLTCTVCALLPIWIMCIFHFQVPVTIIKFHKSIPWTSTLRKTKVQEISPWQFMKESFKTRTPKFILIRKLRLWLWITSLSRFLQNNCGFWWG